MARDRQLQPPDGPQDAGRSAESVQPELPARADQPPPVAVPRAVRAPGLDAPDVTVEVMERTNGNVLWGPTGSVLRGHWDSHNMCPGDQSEAGLLRMPEIPGVYLTVSPRQRTVAVQDPLRLDENRQILAEASRIHRDLFKREFTHVPEDVRPDQSESDLATWLFWMMRLVKAGMARLVAGRLPEREEEIRRAFPGAVINKKFFDSAEQQARAQQRVDAVAAAT
jgi:hypothetical protein